MNSDMIWQLVRYFLLSAGSYLTAKGLADDATMQAMVTAIGTLIVGGWGMYVKWSTKSVPAPVVAASEVNPNVPTIPTVSSATGTVKQG